MVERFPDLFHPPSGTGRHDHRTQQHHAGFLFEQPEADPASLSRPEFSELMFPVAWHPLYPHPVPEGHRFPMEKYELLPQQLLHEGTLARSDFFRPEGLDEERILNVHEASYWEKLITGTISYREARRTGFEFSEQLVDRERTIMNGTLLATEYALEGGVAMNIAGGTHHAYRDRGEAFCLLNDLALAADHCLREHGLRKILIVDLDVHQGNGTASILKDEERSFTFSMHGAGNYPMERPPSDLDVPLPDGTGDETYLKELRAHYPKLLDEQRPELILYQSGVDVLSNDRLGRLGLSIEGCKERDRIVLEGASRKGVPLAACMGGGYSTEIRDIIEAHANTYRLAARYYR
jgi:acetoin utilization deacetylase AcuC-like enzyme